MKDKLLISLKGMCMGAADVVPGVSGGTMAFILGIYARLLEAIRSFDIALLKMLFRGEFSAAIKHTDIVFLLSLFAGIVTALAFFTRVVPIPVLIHSDPEVIYGLFFGLILASIYILVKEIKDTNLSTWLFLFTGIVLALIVVNLVPRDTPYDSWFIFLAGAIAICAMILPGISGSFILLLLGKYAYIFNAIGHFNLSVLLPFAAGAVVGLMLFSRTLVWLLHHHYKNTLSLIIGILVGSLWLIWPFQTRVFITVREKERLISSSPHWPELWTLTHSYAVGMVVIGIILVWGIHAYANKKS